MPQLGQAWPPAAAGRPDRRGSAARCAARAAPVGGAAAGCPGRRGAPPGPRPVGSAARRRRSSRPRRSRARPDTCTSPRSRPSACDRSALDARRLRRGWCPAPSRPACRRCGADAPYRWPSPRSRRPCAAGSVASSFPVASASCTARPSFVVAVAVVPRGLGRQTLLDHLRELRLPRVVRDGGIDARGQPVVVRPQRLDQPLRQ